MVAVINELAPTASNISANSNVAAVYIKPKYELCPDTMRIRRGKETHSRTLPNEMPDERARAEQARQARLRRGRLHAVVEHRSREDEDDRVDDHREAEQAQHHIHNPVPQVHAHESQGVVLALRVRLGFRLVVVLGGLVGESDFEYRSEEDGCSAREGYAEGCA